MTETKDKIARAAFDQHRQELDRLYGDVSMRWPGRPVMTGGDGPYHAKFGELVLVDRFRAVILPAITDEDVGKWVTVKAMAYSQGAEVETVTPDTIDGVWDQYEDKDDLSQGNARTYVAAALPNGYFTWILAVCCTRTYTGPGGGGGG